MSTARSQPAVGGAGSPRAPVAWWPIALIAGTFAVAAVLLSARYGHSSDELYFLAAGRHPAAGYADQGPAVPLIARAMETLVPNSVLVLRLPSVLATVAYIVLAALTARELGANRTAQSCAAAACVLVPHVLVSARLLTTYSFDQALWAWVLWLVVRWVRRHTSGSAGDGLLFGAGVVSALALLVKPLIAMLWPALIIAVGVAGPRRMLGRPGLWAGGAVCVLAALPTLLWQARNGWPYLEMTGVVSSETGSFAVVWFQQIGPFGAILLGLGLGALLFDRWLRPYRFLGLSVLVVCVVFVAVGGRAYYLAGCYPLLFAAAAVFGLRWWQRRPRRLWRHAASAGLAAGVLAGSLYTADRVPWVLDNASDEWGPLVAQVAHRYHAVPGSGHATAVITADYWSAAALSHFGPSRGLDRVYSPGRGFGYLHRPGETVERVVYLGAGAERLHRFFGTVRKLEPISTQPGMSYHGTPVWLVQDPKTPWPRLWPQLRHLSLW